MRNDRDAWAALVKERSKRPAAPDAGLWAMLESEWQAQVVKLAEMAQWKVYHTYDARRSAIGFPDLVCLRAPRLVVAELKRMGEEPTVEQWGWLDHFSRAGAEVYVWCPDKLEEVRQVFSMRTDVLR